MTTSRSSDLFQIYLVDEEGQSTLSIDDGAKRQSLRVEIVNTSGRSITLKDLVGNLATNYHFYISFRPGTLINQGKDVTLVVPDGQGKPIEGWQIEQAENDEAFFLRLNTSTTATAKEIKAGQRITLVLGNIGAAPAGGSRGSRVEIRLANLKYANSGQDIPNQSRLHYLNIVNQRGKKQIPLYVGFLGSNTILNDGSENELTLSIQSLPSQNVPLRIEPYSSDRFTDLQNVTSNQTSFGKTVIELLQEQPEFKTFLIDIVNKVIDEGMQTGIVLNEFFSNYNLSPKSISGFTATSRTIISTASQEIASTFKESIGNLINKYLSNKLLDGRTLIQILLETTGEIQDSFVAAMFTPSNSATNELYNHIKKFLGSSNVDNTNLSQTRFLGLILPNAMASVNLFDELKNEKNPTKKENLANGLIASVTSSNLISADDLEVILSILRQLNFTPAATELQKLSILQSDNIKSVETGVLGFKGISSGDTLNQATANIALDESVKITISFDVATADADMSSKHWALVEKTNADDIQIGFISGQENWVFGGKLEQGITPQWSFICKKPFQLTNREEILRLSISKLKTQLLSGYANLYIHYQNFPGYWDGFITVPIHKGPLVYRECEGADKVKVGCVGIGTDKPKAKLHVKSVAGIIGLRVEGNAEITGNLSMGKLGIGTTNLGDNKLTVQGNTAVLGTIKVTPPDEELATLTISSDGYYDRSAGLEVDEGNKKIPDRNQSKPFVIAGTEDNNSFLRLRARLTSASEGNQWELTAKEDNSLYISNPSSVNPNKMVITDDGVGIGTADLENSRLKVEGDAVITSNLTVGEKFFLNADTEKKNYPELKLKHGNVTLRIGIYMDGTPYLYADFKDKKAIGFYITQDGQIRLNENTTMPK